MRKSTICLALVMLLAASAILVVPAASLEPPPMVDFEDQQELEALIAAAALPDEELEEYLAEQGYDWNRMDSRSDLDRFLEPFRLLGYPDAPEELLDDTADGKYFGMTYYPTYEYTDVCYKIDGIRYRFFVQMDGKVNDYSDMKKVGTYAIEDLEFDLYEPEGEDYLTGEMYYENLAVGIIVQYYEHIEDISFEPFFWHKVETNPVIKSKSNGFPYEIVAICAVAVVVAGAVAVVIRKKKRAAE